MTREEITNRCRWATRHNQGHPSPAWSSGEQLAVALVLRDKDHLTAMGYTLEQAAEHVCDDAQLTPLELTGWLGDIRTELDSTADE